MMRRSECLREKAQLEKAVDSTIPWYGHAQKLDIQDERPLAKTDADKWGESPADIITVARGR